MSFVFEPLLASRRAGSVITTGGNMSLPANPPSYLEHGGCRFLIFDAPTDTNLAYYIKCCQDKSVRKVVRACEPSYSTALINKNDMEIVEMCFGDGQPPSDDIIGRWLDVVEHESEEKRTVAVHCVAGLGRAPVLVAIALMELASMSALDAIELIRGRRRGAINRLQFNYLKNYRKRRSDRGACCLIC